MNNILRKIIFTLVSSGSLCTGGYFSFWVAEPNYAMTGIWLTFSLFTFAIGWPEVAESISFLGNNIKLREVKNAINELKHLAATLSSVILESIQSSGRYGDYTEAKQLEAFDRIDKLLKSLDFSAQEIQVIESPWHEWNEIDYINNILVRSNVHHPLIPKEKSDEWKKRKKDLDGLLLSLTPNDLRKLFQEFDAYTEEVRFLIDDFEYYKNNKQHRDPEKWKQRHQWFKGKTQ